MNAIDKRPYELFQRKDSPNRWMRFSIAGHGQKRIGLKTPEFELARVLAEREYQKAVWSAEAGVLQGKTSFSKLAQQYLDRLNKLRVTDPKHDTKYFHDKGIIDRYLVPYFGKKTITSISHAKCKSTWNGVVSTGPLGRVRTNTRSNTSEMAGSFLVRFSMLNRHYPRSGARP